MRKDTPTHRENYVDSLYAVEDSGLRGVRERLVSAGRWGVNIGASEGKILQVLIAMSAAKRIVEIGTLFGYSTVWMARALGDGGHIFTLEKDAVAAAHARVSFAECGVAERVSLLEGDAIDSLTSIEARGPFDLVFIDANKSAYPKYLEWAERNLRDGGIVVADNVLLGGAVYAAERPSSMSQKQWQGMRDFNLTLADPAKFLTAMLPTLEGLTVAVYRKEPGAQKRAGI